MCILSGGSYLAYPMNVSYETDLTFSSTSDFAMPTEDAVEALAATIQLDLAKRLLRPELLLEYGADRRSADTLEAWHQELLVPSKARLVQALRQALNLMKLAEPKRRGRLTSAISQFTGAAMEEELKREVLIFELAQVLEEADEAAKGVRQHITKVDALAQSNRADRIHAAAHIKAGTDYLAEVGSTRNGEVSIEALSRLRRKIQELATILASAEILQLELARARSTAIDLLERYASLKNALVPNWRQHGGRATATIAARSKVENGLKQVSA